MTELKNSVKSGVLSGVEISDENAKVIGEVAHKLEELDNGVIDPEEETIAELMGAAAKPKDLKNPKDIIPANAGSQSAEQGVLTGVNVDAETAEEVAEVAEKIEELTEYEKSVNSREISREDNNINDIGEALAVAMGVEPTAKKPGEI